MDLKTTSHLHNFADAVNTYDYTRQLYFYTKALKWYITNELHEDGDTWKFEWYIIAIDSLTSDIRVFTFSYKQVYGENVEKVRNAIRDIVALFDRCYCIDLANGVVYGSAFQQRYYLGGHMNAAGYEYTAYVMNTYIDWLIRNNFDDFKDAALVGSPYEIIPENP